MDGRGWSGVASKVRRIAEKASAKAENVNVSFFLQNQNVSEIGTGMASRNAFP